MLRLVLISLFLIVSLSGCNPRKAQRLAFSTREVVLMDGYYSADPKAAEQSLLGLSEHLWSGQKQKLESRDYDYTLALVHGRLALLYQQTGRTAEADKQFTLAFGHMDKSAAHQNIRLPEADRKRKETLVQLITMLDKNREVKWKKP